MKTLIAIGLMCSGSLALAEDTHPGLLGYNIIAVNSYGRGMRFTVPFYGTFGSGGRQMWEAIAEPYYAKTEDGAKVRDVNLFSLCGIKISAATPETNPAHLTINFTHMNVPTLVKLSKEQIVSALLICVVYGDMFPPREKPLITIVGRSEDQKLLDDATKQYKIASDGDVNFDLNQKNMFAAPKHPTLREQLDEVADNIKANAVVLDIKHDPEEEIIVRDITLNKAHPIAYEDHYYRFEFYQSNVLQNCDTWKENNPPGKVTATWGDDKNCKISMLDGWLEVTFNRDVQPHWTFGRRID